MARHIFDSSEEINISRTSVRITDNMYINIIYSKQKDSTYEKAVTIDEMMKRDEILLSNRQYSVNHNEIFDVKGNSRILIISL